MRQSTVAECAGKKDLAFLFAALNALPRRNPVFLTLRKWSYIVSTALCFKLVRRVLMGSRWLLAIAFCLLLLSGCGISQTTGRSVVNGQFDVVGPIIRDTVTGLEWQVGPDRDMTWDEAKAWTEGLRGNWRMPTRAELQGLWRSGICYENWGPFENDGWWVWSGETYDPSTAWAFYFYHGHENWGDRTTSQFNRAFAVRSQTEIVDGRIYGRVESSDGVPLIGATVLVVHTAWGVMTNSLGEYSIRFPVEGSYTLLALMTGMADRTSPVLEVFSGDEVEFNFTGDNPIPGDPRGYSLSPVIADGTIVLVHSLDPGTQTQDQETQTLPLHHLSVSGGMIFDHVTGLQWLVGQDRGFTWEEAVSWVSGLGNGWRMPALAELRGLWDAGIRRSDWGPFENSGRWVWSGEFPDSSSAWLINFNDVQNPEILFNRNTSYNKRAFAVRSP